VASVSDRSNLFYNGALLLQHLDFLMARWPRHAWTTVFTYAAIFVLFPVLCYLAYRFVYP